MDVENQHWLLAALPGRGRSARGAYARRILAVRVGSRNRVSDHRDRTSGSRWPMVTGRADDSPGVGELVGGRSRFGAATVPSLWPGCSDWQPQRLCGRDGTTNHQLSLHAIRQRSRRSGWKSLPSRVAVPRRFTRTAALGQEDMLSLLCAAGCGRGCRCLGVGPVRCWRL